MVLLPLLMAFNLQTKPQIRLTYPGGKSAITEIKQVKAEKTNGFIYISALTNDNQLLQFNKLSEAAFKKDTTFRSRAVQILLITDKVTYKNGANKLPIITIKSTGTNRGNTFEITSNGMLYKNKQWVKFSTTFKGTFASERKLKTN